MKLKIDYKSKLKTWFQYQYLRRIRSITYRFLKQEISHPYSKTGARNQTDFQQTNEMVFLITSWLG